MSVFRVYVEKKVEYAVESKKILKDIENTLQIKGIDNIRFINRYDVQGLEKEDYEKALNTVFCEPSVDNIFFDLPILNSDERILATEFLPGQFDQRADSCEQCISLLLPATKAIVKNAHIYIFSGDVSAEDFDKIKNYIINPVESREAVLATTDDISFHHTAPEKVEVLTGFITKTKVELQEMIAKLGLAMDIDDIEFCQDYFKNTEEREPTLTEIKMIDTYWSDHCRHTTFLTNVDKITIENDYIKETYDKYTLIRENLYKDRKDKAVTLMDLATIAAKWLKKQGVLKNLDESEEINACSVKIKVQIDKTEQDYLLMFKNETHNHPTEIEPFGGAATCLGGAIRDPLSGRSYVYQAMRVTGSGDPLVNIKETLDKKLPQKKISLGATAGYSAYGNQIGLATGQVSEIYHPGYIAKHMEIGAVIGAVPAKNVVREEPIPGDCIILLGGKTGRDGLGGATGSSKSHTLESLETCGAEVQKGNGPEERKLQRLFRNSKVTQMIKRCNDFGAGGISVAIGELSDGLEINLDVVPKKYEGLNGTELAISESQERMACVVAKEDVVSFIKFAGKENLLATKVAVVTKEKRLKLIWQNEIIVNLSREFLNSNGSTKHTEIEISKVTQDVIPATKYKNLQEDWEIHMSELNIALQKGLGEHFDSTNGANTVLMPFGGEYQTTPIPAMVAKIPVEDKNTTTCSVMSYGYNPYISERSPYHGAMYAVVESVAKAISVGGSLDNCYLTFQEYFERTQNDPKRWGKPAAALLGALKAQLDLGIAAIGGKDSMSGTFLDIDVPPTLVSFAVTTANSQNVISNDIKSIGSTIAMALPKYDENGIIDFEHLKELFATIEKLIKKGYINACQPILYGGVSEALFKMCTGNKIGLKLIADISADKLFNPIYGGFILEFNNNKKIPKSMTILGQTTSKYYILFKSRPFAIDLKKVDNAYENKFEKIYPFHTSSVDLKPVEKIKYKTPKSERISAPFKIATPRVIIPVFPGTNCEYDTAKAFNLAGAKSKIFVINNLSKKGIEDSIVELTKLIRNSQILMLPGGFSGGDEPDGSGKFISSFLKNPQIMEAINELLHKRDGLALGICNGFQALIKLGLVPFGEIVDITPTSPTLTFNAIGRHQSMMINTRISSNKSPWLYNTNVGDIHTVPISHGEGRFVAPMGVIENLIDNGQIATQYVDLNGFPTYDVRYNPNGSMEAIESITSPDGRVLGKMAHSERMGPDISKNVEGYKDQHIFKSGVEYFTK